MRFTKMQAYGNDYVYIDAINQKLDNLNLLAKFVSDHHFGIGSDGMIIIEPSKVADFKMRVFDPDGTEAEMCGNGLRSVGKYVYDHKLTSKTNFTIETLGGIKNIFLDVLDGVAVNIKANIGKPIFDPKLIPVICNKNKFWMEEVEVLDKKFIMSSLSWGNPHTVIFMKNLEALDILKYGPAIEHLDIFPKRTNVTFCEIVSDSYLKIREWERGCGETIGCGTGCATAVVIGYENGLCSNKCRVLQVGGPLDIEYDIDSKELYMKGPSYTVFESEIDVSHIIGGK